FGVSGSLSPEVAHTLYIFMLTAAGIAFFLFLFFGSLGFIGQVLNGHRAGFPTTALPIGVAAVLIVNLSTLPLYNTYHIASIPLYFAKLLSFLLWGFAAWSFLLTLGIAVKNFWSTPPALSAWAYVFPIGIFIRATMAMARMTHLVFYRDVMLLLSIVLNLLWISALITTVRFLSNLRTAAASSNATS
ncbi:MAG: hypothetical protein OWS74_07945, partial [Firmicutes bacterium]|nr:hypothetical protein [Bacillota bacterium]